VLGGGAILSVGLASLVIANVPGMTRPIKKFFVGSSNDVIVTTVRSGTLDIMVTEKGALESSKNQDAYCAVEGTPTIIMILPEGTSVKKGDIVCQLDSAALKDSLTNQKITTEAASAGWKNAQLTREVAEIAVVEYEEGVYKQDKATIDGEIKLAESDLSRAEDRLDWSRRMFGKGYVSLAAMKAEELALQKTRFALEQAQTKLKVLVEFTRGKTIKELKSEVEKAKTDELAKKATWDLETSKEKKLDKQIASCDIKAPSDGLVVYANDPNRAFGSSQPQIEEGASVRERQKIFSLPDISKMQVNTKIHESHIDQIRVGLKAKIRVDAFSDQVLDGTVTDVAPLPDTASFFSSDIKVYTAKVAIDHPLPGLRPGMNSEVEILVDRLENVLSVPVQAVLEFDGKDHVTKKIDDRYVQTEVALGPSNESFVQVTKGVSANELLVMDPSSLMTDEEKNKAFGSASKGGKRDWSKPGAEVAKVGAESPGAATIATAAGKEGAPAKEGAAGKEAGTAKARAQGKGAGGGLAKKKGGGNRPPFMAKIPQEQRKMLFTATEEEKMEILKKSGLTPEEIEQAQQFMQQRAQGGGFGGGGGGFGGGGGGFGGGGGGRRGGGPPGGGGGGGSDQ
jgi:multidrug efflux pump subunit AcrA (membrane-fusion protein)